MMARALLTDDPSTGFILIGVFAFTAVVTGLFQEQRPMEELFRTAVETIALTIEGGAALFIAVGAIEAIYQLSRRVVGRSTSPVIRKKQVWVHFAAWLLLALEFELAADVLRSAISPTWDDIGQLAAIAVIRTFLNYFLEKDIEKYGEGEPALPAPALTVHQL